MPEHVAGSAATSRLAELESKYLKLAPLIADSPTKEVVSVLHGLIQEVHRGRDHANGGSTDATEPTIADIANLHRTAPRMHGHAVNEPLPVRATAPAFSLRDANGREISLNQYLGRPVVLVFYPLDWSPTCSDQLSLYQSELPEFERFGAAVLGISVDSIYSHGAWAAVRGITFPLLSDFEPKGAVSRRYHAYRPDDGFSERALYVVDRDGLIRYARIARQLDHVPPVEELFDCLAEITAQPRDATPVVAAATTTATARP